MFQKQPFLLDLLHICEIIALICAFYNYKSLKNSYWKWFAFYLLYILIYEFGSTFARHYLKIEIGYYLSLVQIPLEFLFLYWLYAYNSLKAKKIFWLFSSLFLISLALEFNLTLNNFIFKSLNNTIGTLLLLVLVILEFTKQIKSDSILNFKENKMFYINIGVVLFYVGNMPFFGLYFLILKEPQIWSSYYIYFLISNCIMYLLFAASFIWGKPKS